MPGCRRGRGAGWCAGRPMRRAPGRLGSRPGCRGRPWTAGSAPGALAGSNALMPPRRRVAARTPEQVPEMAAALKRENPMRSAAQVERILRSHSGWSPSHRTLQRHFERLELARCPDGRPAAVFGRFEASRPNEMWTGDALHGVRVAGRKTFLFAFIDDHSRAVVGAPMGASRGHRPAGRGVAPRAGGPRRP
jgi:hypothetical protein